MSEASTFLKDNNIILQVWCEKCKNYYETVYPETELHTVPNQLNIHTIMVYPHICEGDIQKSFEGEAIHWTDGCCGGNEGYMFYPEDLDDWLIEQCEKLVDKKLRITVTIEVLE